MEQLTQSLYEFVKDWEPHDFELTEEMEELESGSGITEVHLEAIESPTQSSLRMIHTVIRYTLR